MTSKSNKKSPKKKSKHQKIDHINPSVMHQIAKDLKAYNQIMDQDEMRKAKDKFMDLYQKCEFAYKEILTDYKIKVEGLECIPGYKPKKGEKKFNPERQNICYSQVTKVLPYAGIPIDPRLFCNDEIYKADGNKSFMILINIITHKSSKKAIKEVFDRQTELYNVMYDFLKNFR